MVAGLVLLAVLMMSAGAGVADATPTPVPTPTVTVDFARARPTHSRVGFLHGLAERVPPDHRIAPLHPVLWRGSIDSAPIERAQRFGARYMVVVSDLWGYPGAAWYGRRPPWEAWSEWTRFVRALARTHREANVVWDIWNEPDFPYYWDGTREQLYRTYELASRAIRSVLGPRAVIAGPSVSAYDRAWIGGLLEHCRRHGCAVDALSWHELPPETPAVTEVATHLRDARAAFLRNPSYAAVGARELIVGEYASGLDEPQPAEVLSFVGQLEQGGASAGALACWPDLAGVDSCAAHTLDGLLDPATMRPRAPWWALKWYARGVGSRVDARTDRPSLVALPAARSPDARHAEIVLGYLDTHDRPLAATIDVTLALSGLERLPFLRSSTRIEATVFAVRTDGGRPVVPRRVESTRVRIAAGRGTFVLRGLPMHSAMLVRLNAAGAPQPRATSSRATSGSVSRRSSTDTRSRIRR